MKQRLRNKNYFDVLILFFLLISPIISFFYPRKMMITYQENIAFLNIKKIHEAYLQDKEKISMKIIDTVKANPQNIVYFEDIEKRNSNAIVIKEKEYIELFENKDGDLNWMMFKNIGGDFVSVNNLIGNEFSNMINLENSKGNLTYLTNGKGRVIFHPEERYNNLYYISLDNMEELYGHNSAYYNDGRLISNYFDQKSNLFIIQQSSEDIFSKFLNKITFFTIITVTSLSTLFSILYFFGNKKCSKYISKLSSDLEDINIKTKKKFVYYDQTPELKKLSNNFNDFLNRNYKVVEETKHLDNKEKELKLQVLKAQFDPDLIQNVFLTLRCLIDLEETNMLSKTMKAFSLMLGKYSQFNLKDVNIKDEITTINLFVDLKKAIDDENFVFKYDEEILSLDNKVPYGLLQLLFREIYDKTKNKKNYTRKIYLQYRKENNNIRYIFVNDGFIWGESKRIEIKENFLNLKSIHGNLKDVYGGESGIIYYVDNHNNSAIELKLLQLKRSDF